MPTTVRPMKRMLQGVNWMECGFLLKTAVVNEFKSFLKLVTEAFKRLKPAYLLQHGGSSKSLCKVRAVVTKGHLSCDSLHMKDPE